MSEPTSHASAETIGLDPFSPETMDDPHAFDARLRETAEMVWLPDYGIWFTGRYDTVERVFRDYEAFESSAGTGITNTKTAENWRKPSVILEQDPPTHTKYRRIMTSVLSQRVVRRLTEDFQRRAYEIVAAGLGSGEFDAAELARSYPLQVLPDAVGFSPEGREHLLPYANLNFQAMGPRNELYRRAAEEAEDAAAFVGWQMRREALTPGGLGHTIYGYVDDGEISEEDAGMLVRTFLSAGIDTTIFGLQFALRALAEHPRAWAALRGDPSLARKTFEEALRWNAPSPYIGRTAARDVEIGGATVRRGEKVIMNLAAANRDPRRWDAPERFDLERDTAGHLAFGTGIHGCVGQMMARMEATCFLTAVAELVDTIEPAGEPVRFHSNWLRGYERLPMRATLR
ncbi:cytochrome P450 [Leucobacter allii]|uniref:cytochrome P450 n=1 Tax=Leucobacter allii TaxID=2932247 RepID=UPI001FD0B035|nr:cytochrome P450 [Leucobacter allii]UOR01828.1 cytochrome P450 [Leucobacter allii]